MDKPEKINTQKPNNIVKTTESPQADRPGHLRQDAMESPNSGNASKVSLTASGYLSFTGHKRQNGLEITKTNDQSLNPRN